MSSLFSHVCVAFFLHGYEVWGVFISAFVCFSTRATSRPVGGLVLCPVLGVKSPQCCGHIPARSWVCFGWFCRCAEDVQLCLGCPCIAQEHLCWLESICFSRLALGGILRTHSSVSVRCALGVLLLILKKATTRGKKNPLITSSFSS